MWVLSASPRPRGITRACRPLHRRLPHRRVPCPHRPVELRARVDWWLKVVLRSGSGIAKNIISMHPPRQEQEKMSLHQPDRLLGRSAEESILLNSYFASLSKGQDKPASVM